MRESGYYWIILNPDDDWVIGYYDKKFDNWKICGDSKDWFPDTVNEKRIFF
jgi:hypothetical protein